MAEKAKADEKKTAKAPVKETSAEDRVALNDKARFDYGIMNAEQMSEPQLKKEMKTIDDQVKVGEKENALAEKANS